MLRKFKYLYLSRIDVKISIIIGFFTAITSLILSGYYLNITYNTIKTSISDRTLLAYNSTINSINLDTFININTLTDMKDTDYNETYERMLDIKKTAGIDFLYTAKYSDNEIIYIVDVVESGRPVRFSGDIIDKEIQELAQRALNGESILATEIYKNFQNLFVSCIPVYNENKEIIGIVGIEFDSTQALSIPTDATKTAFIVILALSLTNYGISMFIFKRLKNPLFIEEKTKDMLTGFKNLNVFEVDLLNLKPEVLENKGIVVISINGLNEVINRLGQISGDNYVNLITGMILESKSSTARAYRTGNSEFVLLTECDTLEELNDFSLNFAEKVKTQDIYKDIRCSIAYGCSIFNENLDENLSDTYNRATEVLQVIQKRQYEKMER